MNVLTFEGGSSPSLHKHTFLIAMQICLYKHRMDTTGNN